LSPLYPSLLHNPLQSLTQAPYTTTEVHPNIHKGHKAQQPPHHFPNSRTPLPASPSSAILTNFPNSIASLTNIMHPPSGAMGRRRKYVNHSQKNN
jgi:hypothetical protein